MIKQTTINKLKDVGTWIVFPSSLRDTPLEITDFLVTEEDGTERYLSINEVIALSGLKLVPDTYVFNGIDYTAFRYAGYTEDIIEIALAFDKLGLVNPNPTVDSFKITFDNFTGNEYFIATHSEKRVLDEVNPNWNIVSESL